MFQQWRAVLRGFRRLDGRPLKGGALVRTIGGFVTFFSLAGIINRTCEYMRAQTAWPAGLWGTLWLGGLTCVFLPVSWQAKAAGYLLFCAAPAVYQRRVNALPKNPVPAAPKLAEAATAALGLVCVLAAVMIVTRLVK